MHTPTQRSGTINPPVFYTSAAIIIALVLFASIAPDFAQTFFGAIQDWIMENVSWFYVLTVALILICITVLAVSRFGDIKLGPDHSQPDYSNSSWFSMLFAAGMGIGLMFFGVAEPVMHFLTPPVGDPNTVEAAKEAMKLTFFHWGLHAWSIYAIVALILAFFSYRHGLPLTLRSALYPLIGERIYGPIGHAIDIFAIIGTVLGIATSLGFGVLQINSGFNYLFDIPVKVTVQVVLIIVATGLATLSVVSGLDKGIRRLSETTLVLAVILMLLVLTFGPTAFLFKSYIQNTGSYLSEIINKTFNLYAYEPTDWIGGWTLFYWGWWISWSPFVGMFIARISRGRTIRQFITGVLLVPTGFTLAWMTVFGNSAIDMILNQGMTGLADMVSADSSVALFYFLEYFPFSSLLSFVAVTMVMLFFVTSADSGSMVIDMLASGGNLNTPIWQRVFWASSVGIVAIALLISGGLKALQTVTIASALPFSVVLLASMWGLIKALQLDVTKKELLRYQSGGGSRLGATPRSWQRRLRSMVNFPRRTHVKRFLDEVVTPACNEVADELRKQGFTVEVRSAEGEDKRVQFEVQHDAEVNFLYCVRPRAYVLPDFINQGDEGDEEREERKYFRAEVHLLEGGQDYDVMGWTREEVIEDILNQYEQHMHFLHVVRE
ncbi:BCCT family transporter [Thiopseudomonas acetoxidans]|uniref:Choline BCCT transporter BetT n=1 Tax=Thiopseudomonas acetoxidans TaxID=3041622 RepID=A0ABT7SNW8_9GAMM|nr:choline BCCT transporter BetT [Thiopseudomonas sp. CY1220]MDM7857689.1 choline BCCT transporter BetT [Thiopseudomonas sp. CY1220]